MAKKKLRISDWLRVHLDRQTFPGLRYVDDSKTRFQVDWRHRSSRKWTEESACVFRAWAEYKGLERNFNFTKGKTNFRMALNCQANIRKIREEEMTNPSTNCNVREYMFVDSEESKNFTPFSSSEKTSNVDQSAETLKVEDLESILQELIRSTGGRNESF